MDGLLDNKVDLLAHLMQVHKLDANNAVFIGDRKEDVIAALANEIPVIGVKWGYANDNELERAGANYLCQSPTEILDAITTLIR